MRARVTVRSFWSVRAVRMISRYSDNASSAIDRKFSARAAGETASPSEEPLPAAGLRLERRERPQDYQLEVSVRRPAEGGNQ